MDCNGYGWEGGGEGGYILACLCPSLRGTKQSVAAYFVKPAIRDSGCFVIPPRRDVYTYSAKIPTALLNGAKSKSF